MELWDHLLDQVYIDGPGSGDKSGQQVYNVCYYYVICMYVIID